MFRKLLVTLDESEGSEAILPIVEEAATEGTEIVLLTVAEVPRASLSEGVHPVMVAGAPAPGGVVEVPPTKVAESRDQASQRVIAEKKEYLDRHAADLRKQGLRVETAVALGDAAEEIISCATENQVDAIAMSTHGRSGLAAVIVGSVSGKVISGAHKPVIVVRPDDLK
jgi:nucleotide-binding universal stress UspA family protein